MAQLSLFSPFLKVFPKNILVVCYAGSALYLYAHTIIKLRIALFILTLVGSVPVYGQSMSGIVSDGSTGKLLHPVTVVNITTQKAVYTNEFGAFSIPATEGQRIAFSFVGYKTMQRPITAADINSIVAIKMDILNIELSEFVFRPKTYSFDSAERRATYTKVLGWHRANSITSPFSFVADRLSRESKMRQKFQRNFYKWENEKFIDSRYTPWLVEQQTNLTGDSLAFFMNAHPMPYDYARTASDIELKMWIRYHYRLWLKNPVIPVIDSANAEASLKK